MQLTIGHLFVFFGIVAFPEDCGLIATGFKVSVQAVVGNVQFPAFEPFDVQV